MYRFLIPQHSKFGNSKLSVIPRTSGGGETRHPGAEEEKTNDPINIIKDKNNNGNTKDPGNTTTTASGDNNGQETGRHHMYQGTTLTGQGHRSPHHRHEEGQGHRNPHRHRNPQRNHGGRAEVGQEPDPHCKGKEQRHHQRPGGGKEGSPEPNHQHHDQEPRQHPRGLECGRL